MAIPKQKIRKIDLTEDTAYLYGVYRGDGYVSHVKDTEWYVFGLQVNDKDFLDYFVKILSKITIKKITLSKRDNNGRIFDGYRCNSISYTARTYDTSLCLFLEDLNIENIKGADDKIKIAFLKGMYDSEGCVQCKLKESYRISLSNTELDLLKDCKEILEGLGIKVSKIYNSKSTRCPTINLTDIKSIIRFYQKIGFRIERKQVILKLITDSYTLSNFFRNIKDKRHDRFNLYNIKRRRRYKQK